MRTQLAFQCSESGTVFGLGPVARFSHFFKVKAEASLGLNATKLRLDGSNSVVNLLVPLTDYPACASVLQQ
jgi:hypothetical protein